MPHEQLLLRFVSLRELADHQVETSGPFAELAEDIVQSIEQHVDLVRVTLGVRDGKRPDVREDRGEGQPAELGVSRFGANYRVDRVER